MEKLIAITPPHLLDPRIAIAACKANGMGILDLGYSDRPDLLKPTLDWLASCSGRRARWGVRWDTLGLASRGLERLSELLPSKVPILILAGLDSAELPAPCKTAKCLARQVFLEAYDVPSAQAAIAAGCDGLIIKGHESAGSVSRHSTFILLQELHGRLTVPYWAQGGIGARSAAAAMLAGAAGVVLCEQLWLADESPLVHSGRRGIWSQFDGSETVLLALEETLFRLSARSGRDKFRELERRVTRSESWQELLLQHLATTDDPLVPLGQDIAFAAPLSKRYGTVGRILTGLGASMDSAIEVARLQKALSPDSPLARAHGTRYSIVQGPMTRVSDTAPFAKAIADGGGLPFLALSVMRRPQVHALLTRTKELLGNLPWGVGLLGFMPQELLREQLDVIREVKPPFAIIAGGRPSQASQLDALSITTYLHVPSPGLLQGFIKGGARKFVFEGSECGGHTGPRTSFVLWESAIEVLLTAAELQDPESVHVLFAGGIHDELSAALVSVLAAPLVARGMKIGVLMGTAYLFTREIVSTGALVDEFQAQALGCKETALLQSGVGIYARCANTDFCAEFNRVRRELRLARESEERTLEVLERLNIGRLRIASKGIVHNSQPALEDGSDRYVKVDVPTQRREGMYMMGEVARLRNKTLTVVELHVAIAAGSEELLARAGKHPGMKRNGRRTAHEDIAIIGMACLLPKAACLRTFWQNIIRGVDAFQEVSKERWRPDDFFDPKRGTPDKIYSKWGAFLDDIQFDPTAYGIPPASMRHIEPVQLLALEVAGRALEDAGLDRRPFPRERTATVFAMGAMHDLGSMYIFRTLLAHYLPKVPGLPELTQKQILKALYEHELPKWTEDSFPGFLNNVVAGRVANRFDLRGPNFTVDAACASSLAALDVGMRQLRSGDADVALVGAVDGTNGSVGFMAFAQTYALSPRGRCRPFDDSADGTSIGEGVAAVVLKRLSDAERDGDRIDAVIKGIGSSSDGRNRSLTAPHPQGQVRALHRAYEDAGVDPLTVELIEAHGTGTAVGDKSEIDSLVSVFGARDSVPQTCAVGSVKSMIGHTKLVAGLGGLIKAALALKHGVLPPTLGVEVPNSRVDLTRTPFYINTETRPWLSQGKTHPRRAGVSAFGFGGSNFHTVLEEYTDNNRDADAIDLNPRDAEPLVFFGPDRSHIAQEIERLFQGIEHPEHLDVAQLAYSLYLEQRYDSGSGHCRLGLIATSVADLKQKLEFALHELRQKDHSEFRYPQGLYYRESSTAAGGLCFLFPGQGSQKINMLRDLVATLPKLQSLFEKADALLVGHLPQPLSRFIFPLPVFSDEERSQQQVALNATQIAQPALGVVDLAAFEVLKAYGVQPDFVGGHSYGEYVALCAAGAIEANDLIRLSETRGQIAAKVGQHCPWAMAAVDADGVRVETLIARHRLAVNIAILNAPDQTIIGGTAEAIDGAVEALREEALRVTRLPVTAAFHTPAMADACGPLAAELARIEFHEPKVSVFSNITGDPYPSTADAARALLARHFAEPLRFTEEIEHLYGAGARIFVEVGPGVVLCGLVDRILGNRPHAAVCMDAPGRPGWLQLAHLLTHLFALGVPVQFQAWFQGRALKQLSVAEVLAEARLKANPGPLIWRVNGGRAAPWHTPPESSKNVVPLLSGLKSPATSETTAGNETAVGTPVPGARPSAAQVRCFPTGYRRYSMINDNPTAEEVTAQPEVGRLSSDLKFDVIQSSVTQFIELQREQQRTLCSFLDFLQTNLLGTVTSQVRLSVEASAQSAVPGAAPRGAGLVAVPPTPVLPTQIHAAASAGERERPQPFVPARLQRPGELPNPQTNVSTPAETAPEPPPCRSAGHVPTEQFAADLLAAISQRSGYPEDMLDLNAHLEADLGIDSIKRIEVFSALKDQHELMGDRDEETVLEELSGFKTLTEIIAWYDRLRESEHFDKGADEPKKASTPPLVSPVEAAESQTVLEQPDPVRCYSLRPVAAPHDGKAVVYDAARPMVLVGPASEVSEALTHVLTTDGYVPWQLIPGPTTRALGENLFQVDFSSQTTVDELRVLFRASEKPIGALVNLMGIATPEEEQDALAPARNLFLTLQALEPDFRDAARAQGTWLINLTNLDGQFGLTGSTVFPVQGAGTLGVVKSAAREWPHLRVKSIDIAPGLELSHWIEQVIKEFHHPDTAIEVGFTSQGRWHLKLEPREASRVNGPELDLDEGAVLLVTGGAYGITAEVTKALAQNNRLRLVLVGRSVVTEPEPATTRGIVDPGELRDSLISDYRAKSAKVRPTEVEAAVKRILKSRQIRRNLTVLEETGADLSYHALDVSNADAFGNLIDDVYSRWGKIDGVIHGAGIVDDRLIRHKSLESFAAVYRTKVAAALTLARKLHPESLKFLTFFSSVAGRFGNIGQSDYSAANEVLNKLADRLSVEWPNAHVVSINWGPWEAGMVSEELIRLYALRNIRTIPVEIGVQYCLDVLRKHAKEEPELVITASLAQIAAFERSDLHQAPAGATPSRAARSRPHAVAGRVAEVLAG